MSPKPHEQGKPGAGPADPAGSPATDGWPLPALEALVYEVTALFHRLHAASQELHQEGEFTAGKRGVLRSLDRQGPQTVPQLARARPVSRQYIQMLVNGLVADGYAELVDNPAHKRSRLVRLTTPGTAHLQTLYRREAQALSAMPVPASEGDLLAAAELLASVRKQFESNQWKEAVRKISV